MSVPKFLIIIFLCSSAIASEKSSHDALSSAIKGIPTDRASHGVRSGTHDERYKSNYAPQTFISFSKTFVKFFESSEIKNSTVKNLIGLEIQSIPTLQIHFVSLQKYNPSQMKWPEHCPKNYTEFFEIPICPNKPVDSLSKEQIESFIDFLNDSDSVYFYRLPDTFEISYAQQKKRLSSIYTHGLRLVRLKRNY